MTYHAASSYHERYYTTFKDLKGATWRVSIQDPTFSGSAQSMTAAENPLEWMGNGDDDQTKCVLGSTGYLRLFCKDENDLNVFQPGALRPVEANDRRVIVTRTDGASAPVMVWQGYIKVEDYSQDMYGYPYEVELPIVSMIAASDFFILPRIQDLGSESLPSLQSNTIGDVLRWCLKYMGCEFTQIVTNNPVYRDYNMQTHEDEYERPRHWTQGRCFLSYFYYYGDQYISPMTIKEILETIFYPYGHLYEFGSDFMAWFKLPSFNVELFKIDVQGNDLRFSNYSPSRTVEIAEVNMQNVNILSTDNVKSILSGPSRISYNIEAKKNDICYSPKSCWMNEDATRLNVEAGNFFMKTLTTVIISGVISDFDHLDCDYMKNISHEADVKLIHCGTTEMPSVPSGTDPSTISMPSYNLTAPCAFYMYNKREYIPNNWDMWVTFDMSVNPRVIESKTDLVFIPHYGRMNEQFPNSEIMQHTFFRIMSGNKYLHPISGSNGNSEWLDVTEGMSEDQKRFTYAELYDTEDGKYLRINPSIFSGNNSCTFNIEIRFRAHNNSFFAADTVWPIYFIMKYEKDNKYTTHNILINAADGVQFNQKNVAVGGSGNNIDITFKTMASKFFTNENCNDDLPNNGFCDARNVMLGYPVEVSYPIIDTGNRAQLEIAECECAGDPIKMVASPCYVIDGSTKYIPVATGMNARDCTTRVKLISSNR